MHREKQQLLPCLIVKCVDRKGVHVVTVNDGKMMRKPIVRYLNFSMTVIVNVPGMAPEDRLLLYRRYYIPVSTNSVLIICRDNLAHSLERFKNSACAPVDEVGFILIDGRASLNHKTSEDSRSIYRYY